MRNSKPLSDVNFEIEDAGRNPYQPLSPPSNAPVEESKWPITFESGHSIMMSEFLPMIGGGLALLFALLMFLVHLFVIDAGQFAMHASTTLPAIGGVFMLMGAYGNRNAARRIRLWPQGVEVTRRSTETIPWESICDVRVADSTNPGTIGHKVITLVGADNEPVSTILGSFREADRIVEAIQRHCGAGAIKLPEQKSVSAAGRKKGRRTALITGFGGLLLLAAGIFLPIDAYQKHRAARLLETEAVDGSGVVTETLTAPNGHTRRVHYEVQGTDGRSASHNVEVTDAFFRNVTKGDSVPVRYVPDEPSISRLQEGEVLSTDIMDSPVATCVLGLFGLIASCGFMLPMTILQWKGYDVNFNNWKVSLVPLQ